MYWKYELACKEAGMKEEDVKKIRRIFEDDRKRIKYKERIIEEMQYTRISIDSEMDDEDRERVFEIPDPNVDVESEALWNLNMEKLQECLMRLTPEEKAEQDRLRQAYIRAIRENLRGNLNSMKIQYPDGSVVDLGEKYGGIKREH